MLTYVVKPVLAFIHFLQKASSFLLNASSFLGRTIFLLLLKIFNLIRDIFVAVVIIVEELYHFVCELNASLVAVSHYVQTSANGGVNCAIEAVVVFSRNISKFFLNTKLHSKLLATKLGLFVGDFFELIRKALLLIADCTWYLVTLLPRLLGFIVIYVGDLIVNSITVIRKSIIYTVTVVVEDIFRLTIGVVILIVLLHNRRRLASFTLRSCLRLKRIIVLCCRRLLLIFNRLLRRRTNPSVVRTPARRSFLPRQSVSPAASDKSVDPTQRCVVCRDRQKCVLLLPCKHLCLCEDCADYILFSGHRQTCPLCRTDIAHSMSVYT